MSQKLLSVTDVAASYGGVKALRGISLEVRAGSVVCVIGPNGAGKSTLMKVISGLMWTRSGKISFNGDDISKWSAQRIARHGLLQVPEGRRIIAPMSVEENLDLGALPSRSGRREKRNKLSEVYELFPTLWPLRQNPGGSLSGGEQQMLAVGRALMGRPKLLLLDEPSLGLAPAIVEEMFLTFAQLRDEGLTILLVEQNASLALEVSDYGYVLQRGVIAKHARAEDLRKDEVVIELYLGSSDN